PVVIRPSYVLGGRAMEIVRDRGQLQRYISEAVVVSGDSPVLIDSYLDRATEVDVDVLADAGDIYVAGIMEHIEEAGIHSGDSACSLPPYSLPGEVVRDLGRQSALLARALDVRGLMNVQFAVKDGEIFILEVNPRASRTVPFVAKATGVPVAKLAARVMAGEPLAALAPPPPCLDHVSVKEAVFPFNRFPGVDTLLGPEMRSTGEVMGIDADFPMAYAKAQLAAGQKLPLSGTVFISVRDADKEGIVDVARRLHDLGFAILATGGTARLLQAHGVPAQRVNKVLEGRPHIVDAMANGEVQLVINTTEGAKAQEDSRSIRRQALVSGIPYTPTLAGARATAAAIAALRERPLEVKPLQAYSAAC
ncbi:MAG TPA: ATP-grasp domain-containing protein, partial [Thermopetrobacter sp.]|nr:ATP-grasp domain-containing protein [Thermopetrobacter sp.]